MTDRVEGTDNRAAAAQLRAALDSTGLTQTAFAAALGTSQPRLSTYLNGKVSPSASFFVHFRQVADALAGLARLHMLSAPTMGTGLRSALQDDEDWAFRLLIQGRDHLRIVLAQHPELRGGWMAAPLSSGLIEWDTLTAGVVGREFTCAGLEPPPWTRREPLPVAWNFPSLLFAPHEVRAATPDWLACLNIFMPERDLVTA